MRGLRSFLLLLVVAVASRRVPLLRRVEARSGRSGQEGQGLHRRSGQDRRADGEVRVGRPHDAQEDRDRVADRAAAVATPSDGAAVSGHHEQPVDARAPARHRRESAGPRRVRSGASRASKSPSSRAVRSSKLLIGRKTPAATDLYAKLGDSPRVFLIPGFVDTTFNKTTFDLRDKTVLKVDRDRDRHARRSPRRSARCSSRKPTASGSWHGPVKARADFTTVDGLVSRLNTLQTKSIVAPSRPRSPSTGSTSPTRPCSSGRGRRRRRSSSARRPAKASSTRRTSRGRSSSPSSRRSSTTSSKEIGDVPAEGSLRCPRLQRDPPRSDAQRADRGVREDEDEEQGRAGRGEVEAVRADRRVTSIRRRSTT